MKKSRSRAYPAIDLEEAYSLFVNRLSDLSAAPQARENLLEMLGYSSSSGGIAGRKVAALVQYGFVERHRSRYSVSKFGDYLRTLEVGSRALDSAIQTAFNKPPLFREIVSAYERFGELPSDFRDLLGQEFRIAPRACSQVDEIFVSSAVFAGILNPGRKFVEKENFRLLEDVEQRGDDARAKDLPAASAKDSRELKLEPRESFLGPWRYPLPSGTSFGVAFMLPQELSEEDHVFVLNQLQRIAESVRELRPPVRATGPKPVAPPRLNAPFLSEDSIQIIS